MNKLTLFVLSFSTVGFSASIPVSVTRFNQDVTHYLEGCGRWSYAHQDQLRLVLESQLSQHGLKVLERQSIRSMHENEFQMANLNQKTVAKKNRFIAAKYTVTGGITELGICEDSSGSGIQLGGVIALLGGPSADLELKKKKTASKIKVTAQLISVKTGEVLKSFTAQSEITESSGVVSAGAMGIGGSHRQESNPPIERATNQALADLAKQIAGHIQM